LILDFGTEESRPDPQPIRSSNVFETENQNNDRQVQGSPTQRPGSVISSNFRLSIFGGKRSKTNSVATSFNSARPGPKLDGTLIFHRLSDLDSPRKWYSMKLKSLTASSSTESRGLTGSDAKVLPAYWNPRPSKVQNLLHIEGSRRRIPSRRIELAVTGRKAVIVGFRGFWVIDTATLSVVCAGRFQNDMYEMLVDTGTAWQNQVPIPDRIPVSNFEDVALHDDFLAIAMGPRIVVFRIDSQEEPGRWVCTCVIESAWIQKLQFSKDGTQLFVLVRRKKDDESWEQILVLSRRNFVPLNLFRAKPDLVQPLLVEEWAAGDEEHVNFTVSSKKDLIAAYTSPSGEFSSVKILRRDEDGLWNDLGSQKIRKNTLEDSTTWGAKVRDIRL